MEEFNENRKEEPATDKQGVLTRDGSLSHGTILPESIDATPSTSIDTSPRRRQNEAESIDMPYNASIDTSKADIKKIGNLKNGNSKFGNLVDDDYYKRSHRVEAISQTL